MENNINTNEVPKINTTELEKVHQQDIYHNKKTELLKQTILQEGIPETPSTIFKGVTSSLLDINATAVLFKETKDFKNFIKDFFRLENKQDIKSIIRGIDISLLLLEKSFGKELWEDSLNINIIEKKWYALRDKIRTAQFLTKIEKPEHQKKATKEALEALYAFFQKENENTSVESYLRAIFLNLIFYKKIEPLIKKKNENVRAFRNLFTDTSKPNIKDELAKHLKNPDDISIDLTNPEKREEDILLKAFSKISNKEILTDLLRTRILVKDGNEVGICAETLQHILFSRKNEGISDVHCQGAINKKRSNEKIHGNFKGVPFEISIYCEKNHKEEEYYGLYNHTIYNFGARLCGYLSRREILSEKIIKSKIETLCQGYHWEKIPEKTYNRMKDEVTPFLSKKDLEDLDKIEENPIMEGVFKKITEIMKNPKKDERMKALKKLNYFYTIPKFLAKKLIKAFLQKLGYRYAKDTKKYIHPRYVVSDIHFIPPGERIKNPAIKELVSLIQEKVEKNMQSKEQANDVANLNMYKDSIRSIIEAFLQEKTHININKKTTVEITNAMKDEISATVLGLL